MVIQIAEAINLYQLRGNDLSAAGNLFIPQFQYCFKFRELTECEKKRSDKYKITSTCFEVPFFFTLFITGKPAESCPKRFRTCTQIFIPFFHMHMYAVAWK